MYSYIGVALRKSHCISWIKQIKKFLLICALELKNYDLENPTDYKSTILRLHTIVSFSSTNTWLILKLPEMEKLKAGMNQFCSNIMGHLVRNGFYSAMQVKKTADRFLKFMFNKFLDSYSDNYRYKTEL